jgi:hypothetical protein
VRSDGVSSAQLVIGRACTARDTRDEETQGWAGEYLGENTQGFAAVDLDVLLKYLVLYCIVMYYSIASQPTDTHPHSRSYHSLARATRR